MSEIPSLTLSSVLKVLTYDQYLELSNKINENTYYYLIADDRMESMAIPDLSVATKIVAFSPDEILIHLANDKHLIRFIASEKESAFPPQIVDAINRLFEVGYHNRIDDTDNIYNYVRENMSFEEIKNCLLESYLDEDYTYLNVIHIFDHNFNMITFKKNEDMEGEIVLEKHILKTDLIAYKFTDKYRQ